MSLGCAITALAAGAEPHESSFTHEALEKGRDAMGSERPLECVAYILVGDGVVVGKESGESLLYVGILSVEDLPKGFLTDRKILHSSQKVAVGLEVDACHVNVAAVIVAILHLYLALYGQTESAYSRQLNGVALLHLVEHDALQVA